MNTRTITVYDLMTNNDITYVNDLPADANLINAYLLHTYGASSLHNPVIRKKAAKSIVTGHRGMSLGHFAVKIDA
jgi:hypothetical protein